MKTSTTFSVKLTLFAPTLNCGVRMTSTKINSEKQQRLLWTSYSIQLVVFEVLGPFACQLECDALVSQLVHPNTG